MSSRYFLLLLLILIVKETKAEAGDCPRDLGHCQCRQILHLDIRVKCNIVNQNQLRVNIWCLPCLSTSLCFLYFIQSDCKKLRGRTIRYFQIRNSDIQKLDGNVFAGMQIRGLYVYKSGMT